MDFKTFPEALVHTARRKPQAVAMRYKDLGLWQSITWSEYLDKVKYVALGLHNLGIKKGDNVSIIGENKPEWCYSAFGTMSAGATFAGIYTTNPATECEFVVGHSESVVYFCDDEEQFDKALIFRKNTPNLRKLIVWDMEGLKHFQDPMLMSFDELIELGKKVDQEKPDLFSNLVAKVKGEDIAGIIYTSGTTGHPKGAMIAHECYMWMAEKIAYVGNFTEKDETISYLPMNHIYEQETDFMLHTTIGTTIHFVESTDTFARDLQEVSPTMLQGVPRIWEKMHSSIILRMDDAAWIKRVAFNTALRVGSKYNTIKLSGQRMPFLIKIGYNLAYFAVFWKLKERLGFDRVRLGFSGAAPISHEILKFFQSIGIPIREGYGMTETTGITHMSDLKNFRVGTVGKPLPETQVMLADDGEIIVKHAAIFKGYYHDEEKTKEVLIDGWMHTGDVGEIDEEGFLKITDRKKDLIITAGGKNVAPQFIENLLKFSPYINDSVVIGDGRKYLTAIIIIDEENIMKYTQDQKVQYTTYASLTKTEKVNQLIQSEINKVNKQLARVEQIKKFTILDKKLYAEDGEVTPTMKVKRKAINEQYSDLINSMYK
jgi:long-chain acyl-CoA synthetase